jgi:predicted ester cyclase
LVSGDKVIVRGQANGTPPGDFIGAPHRGQSFSIMSIDIHTIENGKIIRTFHVEDMLGAQTQLMKK